MRLLGLRSKVSLRAVHKKKYLTNLKRWFATRTRVPHDCLAPGTTQSRCDADRTAPPASHPVAAKSRHRPPVAANRNEPGIRDAFASRHHPLPHTLFAVLARPNPTPYTRA
jgi:hypothetical protein